MKYPECVRCGKLSPKWSFIGNTLASLFKVFVGAFTGSKGLLADGVHSAADAVSSLFIFSALKVAEKPGDERHPFGYGKVEYISTLFAGIFLFIGATVIFIDALDAFKHGDHSLPDNAAIFATILSLIFSYLMYDSNKCAGTELGSPALVADAYESKADSISSAAVLIGLIGTKMGFVYADTIAAVVVALLIYRMSIEMFFQGIHGLIDMSVDKDTIDEIVNISLTVQGVEGVRSIKTRRMGQKNWVDLKIDVSKKKSVLDTHMISEKVKESIQTKIAEIGGISVSTFPVGKWGVEF